MNPPVSECPACGLKRGERGNDLCEHHWHTTNDPDSEGQEEERVTISLPREDWETLCKISRDSSYLEKGTPLLDLLHAAHQPKEEGEREARLEMDRNLYGFSVVGPDGSRIDPRDVSPAMTEEGERWTIGVSVHDGSALVLTPDTKARANPADWRFIEVVPAPPSPPPKTSKPHPPRPTS